nr:hypothetical protein [Pseudomonas sp. GV071]
MAIPKRHGPSRTIEVVPLGRCEICRGAGVLKGIFHEMACAGCNGSGLVHRETGEALAAEAMVTQLRLRLNHANRQIQHLESQRPKVDGAAQDYAQDRNRRGTGGGNWTGD